MGAGNPKVGLWGLLRNAGGRHPHCDDVRVFDTEIARTWVLNLYRRKYRQAPLTAYVAASLYV